LEWTPARLGFIDSKDRSKTTLPHGCPRVELTLNEDRSLERDLDALKSRRGERMIFEGAGEAACSRQVQAKDRPALTLISCLVQPCGCNPEGKKRRRPKAEVNSFRG
jgi:hypothetical protein